MTKRDRGREQPKRSPLVRVRTRDVGERTRLILYVRAGGRCEFDGCNQFLIEHHLTKREGNYGEAAHIVAFSPEGPRGRSGTRPKHVHDVEMRLIHLPERTCR